MTYTVTAVVLLLMVAVESLSAASHFETYTYHTTESKLNCVTKSTESCSRFLGIKISCKKVYMQECNVLYETVERAGKKCQTGWSSTECDVPICHTACIDGKVCTAPDKCECVTTGGGCQSVPCSAAMNCYPGSCIGNACSCQPGFSGTNCLTINKTPDISVCQVQLYDGATALFKEVACEAPGVDPPQTTTWISAKTLSKVQVKWTSNYVQPFSLPDGTFASHVRNAPVPIGVSETGFSVSFPGTRATVNTTCSAANPSTPQGTVNCEVPRDWANFGVTPAHQQTFRVDVSSKLGGHKDGANSPTITGSNYPPQYFIGTPVIRSALFKFDLNPPVHCLSIPNNDCEIFAIYLEQDITTNPTIEAKVYNWTDDGSGISNFHFEVYFMQPNPQRLLVNVGAPLVQSDIPPNLNNFVYVCTSSGVYSIELTVLDQAGNSAKARKLFVFSKDSKLTTDPNKPVYVKEADPESSYKWITKFDNPQNGGNIPLTLVWTDHFSSSSQFDSFLGLAAQPWNIPGGIDDRFQQKYGRRSIDEITNTPRGIVAYGVAYIVDPKGGGKGFVPDNWVYLNATKETYSLPISSLADGYTIVVWLQAEDAVGDITEKLVVGVDRTPPEVKDASFTPNGVDESTSRMFIQVSDTSSGIQQISFGIYDSKLKNQVYSGTSGPQKRDPSSVQGHRRKRVVPPCTMNDTSCYCIPSGDCYNYTQTVDIDNCWLDRLSGHTLEFRFTVKNGANLTSSEQTVSLGELTLQCRRKDVPVAGIVIGCILGFLVLVALIVVIVLLVRVYVCKKPMPRRVMNAQQTIRNKFTRPQLDENIAYATSDDLHQKNNQVPPKVVLSSQVTALPNKWNPATKASKVEETYVYSSGNGYDDDYSSSPAEAYSSGGRMVISSNQLKFGDTIAEGRFAVIKKAQLPQENETIPVATKGLIRGFTDSDASLMANKIAFQSRIPTHVNVVKFLGQLDDTNETGPMMVLEYCDMSLKDWLSRIDSINSDVLEDMSIFTMNIANGVKHLHENQVIHRRLGARNVLLKKQYGGLVAKLIGFGPNREDKDGGQASLPIKWLAPETLETLKSGSPTYDKNSDAWSFGITVWEIYSKGEVPFFDMQSDKVKKLLTKDKRMVLTRPEACPDDIRKFKNRNLNERIVRMEQFQHESYKNVMAPCWNFNAGRRPKFAEICSKIDTFRSGTGQEPMGYYTANSPYSGTYSGPSELYDDAA